MPEPSVIDRAAVIAYAQHNGYRAAAAQFGVKESTVRVWLYRTKNAASGCNETSGVAETETVKRNRGDKEEDSNREQSQSSGAGTRRVKSTADEFLGKLRKQLHRMLDKAAGMKITEGNIHRIATGLAKAEIAGRVPFGYGGDNPGGAGGGMLNVHLHNARIDSLPPLAHEVHAEVQALPALDAVSTEIEDAKEDES